MSTFIVRFVGDAADAFRGMVRHVATGEEAVFASPADLLAFLEGMNAVSGLAAVPRSASERDAVGRPRLHEPSTEPKTSGDAQQETATRDGGQ